MTKLIKCLLCGLRYDTSKNKYCPSCKKKEVEFMKLTDIQRATLERLTDKPQSA